MGNDAVWKTDSDIISLKKPFHFISSSLLPFSQVVLAWISWCRCIMTNKSTNFELIPCAVCRCFCCYPWMNLSQVHVAWVVSDRRNSGSTGAEGRWDNLYNWRQRQRRRVTEGGWNLHVFDGDWRHHLHKQWGGGWQHLLHDECVCEGCPHTTKWHFESSSRTRRVSTMTRTDTSKHTCMHKRFHFTFSSPMSCKVCNYKGEGGDTGSLCVMGICLICQSIYKHSKERHKCRC